MIETPLRMHDRVHDCHHQFIDSQTCQKCGWSPPPADVFNNLLALWTRATADEQLEFLKRVTIR